MTIFRVPWDANFPQIITHAVLEARDRHPAFEDAKAGDSLAASELVRDLLCPKAVETLGEIMGDREVLLASVAAIERKGFNAIPDLMAFELSNSLGIPIDTNPNRVRQSNKVVHTRSTGWHRLVTPPAFAGRVYPGKYYVLVDDHVGFGSTLANMRGYIHANGAEVIAMTTLTETTGARRIALHSDTLTMLKYKHGEELQRFWRANFGYGIECLTDLEGNYLYRQRDLDTIRRRLVKAAKKASAQNLSTAFFPEEIIGASA